MMACLGYHPECKTFNEELWVSMVERYEFFWLNYVAPELLTGAMIPTPSQAGAHLEGEHAYAGAHLEGEHAYAGSQRCKPTNNLSMDTIVHRKKSVLTASKLPAVFLCGISGLDCNTLSQHSMECTKCKIRMHFVCVNVYGPQDPDVWS